MSYVQEGDLVAGKYCVEKVLGRGGMGIVVAARHTQLEERVAIKLMLPEAAKNPEAIARFVREARAAAKLESVHVARVTDVGTLDNGLAYMVMEFLEGLDLSQLMESHGPLAIGDAVDYVLQAGAAIAEAHSLGIVHRDLKPSNLFLTRRRDRTPLIKVLDFGISKVSGASMSASDGAMTLTQGLMGSPLYMSPEQMTSTRDVDGRSDIWALGVILYELVTGTTPFISDTLPRVCTMVMQEAPPPIATHRADVSPALEAVIMRCLAKHPDARFQNIADLARALVPFSGHFGRTAFEGILRLSGSDDAFAGNFTPNAAAISQTNAGGVITGTNAAWGASQQRNGTRRMAPLFAGGGVLLVATALGVTWWALRTNDEQILAPATSATAATAAASIVPEPSKPPTSPTPLAVRLVPTATEPAPSAATAVQTNAPAPSASAKPGVAPRTAPPKIVKRTPTTATPRASSTKPTLGGRL